MWVDNGCQWRVGLDLQLDSDSQKRKRSPSVDFLMSEAHDDPLAAKLHLRKTLYQHLPLFLRLQFDHNDRRLALARLLRCRANGAAEESFAERGEDDAVRGLEETEKEFERGRGRKVRWVGVRWTERNGVRRRELSRRVRIALRGVEELWPRDVDGREEWTFRGEGGQVSVIAVGVLNDGRPPSELRDARGEGREIGRF